MNCRVISIILPYFHLLLVGVLGTDDTRRHLEDVLPASELDRLWIVRLILPIRKGSFVCAGGIISERWALTSALCAALPVCEQIKIFPSTWKEGDTTTIRGELCINHPKHKLSNYHFYNIGLIKSNEYFDNYRVFAIKILPPEGIHNCPGEVAQVYGWGLDGNGVVLQTLQRVRVKIESWKKCNEAFRECYNRWESRGVDDAPSVIIPQTGFCTNRSDYMGAGGCLYGHSGSPVLIHDIFVGVLSGPLGAESGHCFPVSLHINIADYLPWIYSFISPEIDTSSMVVGIE